MDQERVTIEMLGGFRATLPGGRQAELSRNQAGALLAILALHLGEPRLREQIQCDLWPDDDPNAARHRLRQTLYLLRRELAALLPDLETALLSTRGTLTLDPTRIDTDVRAFDEALRLSETLHAPTARAARLAEAIALHRGPLLPGFYQECFADDQRRLAERIAIASHRLPFLWEAAGEPLRAIDAAQEALAFDPLDEETHCLLMRLYAVTCQRSMVPRQLRQLESLLRDATGERPSTATIALAESLTRAPAHTQPPPSPPAPPPSPVTTPSDTKAVPDRRIKSSAISRAVLISTGLMTLGTVAYRYQQPRRPAAKPTPSPVVSETISPDLPAPEVAWIRLIPLQKGDTSMEPTGIAVGPDGAVAVTGFVDTAVGNTDYITQKLSPSGESLWMRRYNGTGNDLDRARSVAFDHQGNITVTGESDNGAGKGATRLHGLDIVTVLYAPDGSERFVLRWNGDDDGEDRPVGVRVDARDQLWVAGSSWSRSARGGKGGFRMVALKLSHLSTNRSRPDIVWRLPGAADSEATDLAVDAAENVVLTGFTHTDAQIGPGESTVAARLDSNGIAQWIRTTGGNTAGHYTGRRVAVDSRGDAYVAAPSYEGTFLNGRTGYDVRTTHYGLSGATLAMWNFSQTPRTEDWPMAISVGDDGRVSVTGEAVAELDLPHVFVVAYAPGGEVLWRRSFVGYTFGPDAAKAVLVSRTGDTFVCGATAVAAGQYPNGQRLWRSTLFTLRLAPDGTPRTLHRYTAEPTTGAAGKVMALCPDNSVVVAGQTDLTGKKAIVVIKYSPETK